MNRPTRSTAASRTEMASSMKRSWTAVRNRSSPYEGTTRGVKGGRKGREGIASQSCMKAYMKASMRTCSYEEDSPHRKSPRRAAVDTGNIRSTSSNIYHTYHQIWVRFDHTCKAFDCPRPECRLSCCMHRVSKGGVCSRRMGLTVRICVFEHC